MQIVDQGYIYDATKAVKNRSVCSFTSLYRLSNDRVLASFRAASCKDAPDGNCILAASGDEGKNWEVLLQGFEKALGVEPAYVGKNRMDYLVELASAETVRAIRPDLNLLTTFPHRGLIVTSRADLPDFDFISRFFAPQAGITEDPVTGSAHSCLGPFWQARLGKNEMAAYQASTRGGVIRVRVEGDRVYLAGQAVTVLRGELL